MIKTTSKFVSKFLQSKDNVENDTKRCTYILSRWLDDFSVELVLQDNQENSHQCYSCKLSKADFVAAANDLEIPYKVFYRDCKAALISDNLELAEYQYIIDENNMLFKLIRKIDLEITYLEANLKKVDNNFEILDAAIEIGEERKKKLEQQQMLGAEESNKKPVNISHDNNSNERNQTVMAKLEESINQRCKNEDDLLRKFILILNEKKSRIVALGDKLRELTKTGSGNATTIELADDDMIMEGNNYDEFSAGTQIESYE